MSEGQWRGPEKVKQSKVIEIWALVLILSVITVLVSMGLIKLGQVWFG